MLRKALIVGINHYTRLHPAAPLEVAQGAEEMAQKLETDGGFSVTRWPLDRRGQEIDLHGSVAPNDLRDKITELFLPNTQHQHPDVALFYFVGHGDRYGTGTNQQNYLLTSTAENTSEANENWAIPFTWLKGVLADSKVKRQIVWLDCCFSGDLINFTQDELFNNDPDKIRFFISSCQDFNKAYINLQNPKYGLLTEKLLRGLDPTNQGVVSSKSLAHFINNEAFARGQKPMVYCSEIPLNLTATRENRPLLNTLAPPKKVAIDLPDVPIFEGRDELLRQLYPMLLPTNNNKVKVVAIIGQGGIGKTGLVVKLLERLGVNVATKTADNCLYDYVLTYRVGKNTTFDDIAIWLGKILDISMDKDNLPKSEDKLKAIITGLSKQKCLLVLDNLEDILHPENHQGNSQDWCDFLNALAYKSHNSRIILTSREMPQDLRDRRGNQINPMMVHQEPVSQVSLEASVEILREYGVPYSQEELQWIARRVDGHVFVLQQLAGLIKQDNRSFKKLQETPGLITKEAEPILREQLEKQTDPNRRDLLKRMCVFPYAVDIKGLTFLRLYNNAGSFEMAALLSEPAEFTDAEIDETEQIIKHSSLVQKRKDEKKDDLVYNLHQVTRDFLGKEYAKELPQLLESVYKFYNTAKSVENPQNLDDLRPVLEAQYFAFQLGNYDEALSLLQSIDDYLGYWGHWSLQKDLYEQLLPYVDDSDRDYCWWSIGEVHLDSGDWDQAEKCFQESLAISQRLDQKSDIATSLASLGDIESNRGNWDRAEQLYQQCLAIYTKLGDRSGMASSWASLGDIERLRGNWDQAEQLYQQSLDMRTELGDRSGMASSWGVLGDIERNRGNWDRAEQLYQQSLDMMTELGDRSGMAISWGQLGDIERNRGNWDQAEQLFQQCLAIETELGDRSGMASSWGQLGYIESVRGNWDRAEQLYKKYLDMMTELGDRSGMASSWAVLGDIESVRGNWDRAEQLYQQSLDMRTELGDRMGIAFRHFAFGDLYHSQNDFYTAEQYYQDALKMSKDLGSKREIAIFQSGLGKNQISLGNLDLAEQLLTEALTMTEALKIPYETAETQYFLSRLARERGNDTLSAEYYQTAYETFKRLGAKKAMEKMERWEWL